jgi:peptide chain release factor 2
VLRSQILGGFFDYDNKKKQLDEIEQQLMLESLWSDVELYKKLTQQKKSLEVTVYEIDSLQMIIDDNKELALLAKQENDEETSQAVYKELLELVQRVDELEFKKMFDGEMDIANCFIDINSGSGGTEAQDWAEMLLRMYVRYCNNKGFNVEVLEEQSGDVAGIKTASIKVVGDYAFGYLKHESGIHRLVRNSPFDANNKRHTSFASVFIYPEVSDNIVIEINPADLRIDTFRASGAGGQHINKTDSAIRITHIPTGVVVQCQSDRSQHRNKDEAMKMLKSRLYELEMRKKLEEKQQLEDSKSEIGWGHQIRSYVFDQSRVKDLRTGVEVGNVKGVMDGDLEPFIIAMLKK